MTPDILCVVNGFNVQYPIEVYRFFKQIGARYIGFLPLVEPMAKAPVGVSPGSVPAEAFGRFLCTIFDEWQDRDIGRIKVQIFEEAAGTALGRDHELCIFRPTCGDVPVLEYQGDFFSCDHFADNGHRLGNIQDTPLRDLLDCPELVTFGRNKLDRLPRYCRECEYLVLCYGECPKNRLIRTPDGEEGLNYLCSGYRLFFRHSQPFLKMLASLQSGQAREGHKPPTVSMTGQTHIGRNDPCPCGSGKKYKKCCLLKE